MIRWEGGRMRACTTIRQEGDGGRRKWLEGRSILRPERQNGGFRRCREGPGSGFRRSDVGGLVFEDGNFGRATGILEERRGLREWTTTGRCMRVVVVISRKDVVDVASSIVLGKPSITYVTGRGR